MGLHVEPLFHATPEGRLTLRYRCACGHLTDVAQLDVDGGQVAGEQMREHLVDEHPGNVPAGRCGECSTITDYFMARAAIPGQPAEVWLCERHAPKSAAIIDQAAT
jgi:hypothetical protein